MKVAVHVRESRWSGRWLAYCPDLVGCSASASTEARALALVRRRIEEHLHDEQRRRSSASTDLGDTELELEQGPDLDGWAARFAVTMAGPARLPPPCREVER